MGWHLRDSRTVGKTESMEFGWNRTSWQTVYAATSRRFYTEKPFHREVFTQTTFHRAVFSHRAMLEAPIQRSSESSFYTQIFFTRSSFYTRSFYAQTPFHTRPLKQRNPYAEQFLHPHAFCKAFTQRSLYTGCFSARKHLHRTAFHTQTLSQLLHTGDFKKG